MTITEETKLLAVVQIINQWRANRDRVQKRRTS